MRGNTNCRSVADLLWNYTAHTLSELEVERVESHLTTCTACRAEVETYRLTVDALGAMRHDSIPASRRGWHELQARLSAPQPRTSWIRSVWNMPTLAWSSVALAAMVFLLFRPVINGGNGVNRGGVQFDPGGSPSAALVSPPNSDSDAAMSLDEAMTQRLGPDYEYRLNADSGNSGGDSNRNRTIRQPQRIALGGASEGRTRYAVSGRRNHRNSRLNFATMDGKAGGNGVDGNDYVLTPVSTVADSENGTDYVMGGMVMSGRTSDTEVARGW